MSYIGAKLWNDLPNDLKQRQILQILSACCNRGQGQILTTLSALMYELY